MLTPVHNHINDNNTTKDNLDLAMTISKVVLGVVDEPSLPSIHRKRPCTSPILSETKRQLSAEFNVGPGDEEDSLSMTTPYMSDETTENKQQPRNVQKVADTTTKTTDKTVPIPRATIPTSLPSMSTNAKECQVCNEVLPNSNSGLIRHCVTHMIQKPFDCSACQTTYANMPVLKRHLRHVHMNDERAQIVENRSPLFFNQLKMSVEKCFPDSINQLLAHWSLAYEPSTETPHRLQRTEDKIQSTARRHRSRAVKIPTAQQVTTPARTPAQREEHASTAPALTNEQIQVSEFYDYSHFVNENMYGFGATKEIDPFGTELTLAQM